jgi:3-deoxy-7-phosphoheptulonate synthase
VVDVAQVAVGGSEVVVMAGPCSVESAEQISMVAKGVAEAGARILRGGAFKPRTSPYSFQGLGEEGLLLLAAARDQTGLPVVTSMMSGLKGVADVMGRSIR